MNEPLTAGTPQRPAPPKAAQPGSRYQTYRSELPEVCAADPTRMAFTADADGRCEVFTWNAATGRARQVTDRPRGTLHTAIDRDGHVWWFDEDANGLGRWRFQPFEGGPDLPGLEGVPSGVPAVSAWPYTQRSPWRRARRTAPPCTSDRAADRPARWP